MYIRTYVCTYVRAKALRVRTSLVFWNEARGVLASAQSSNEPDSKWPAASPLATCSLSLRLLHSFRISTTYIYIYIYIYSCTLNCPQLSLLHSPCTMVMLPSDFLSPRTLLSIFSLRPACLPACLSLMASLRLALRLVTIVQSNNSSLETTNNFPTLESTSLRSLPLFIPLLFLSPILFLTFLLLLRIAFSSLLLLLLFSSSFLLPVLFLIAPWPAVRNDVLASLWNGNVVYLMLRSVRFPERGEGEWGKVTSRN